MKQIIDQAISWDKIGNHEKSEYTYSLGNASISKHKQVLDVNIKLNFIIPHDDLKHIKQGIRSKVASVKDIQLSFDYINIILTEEEAIRLYIPYMLEAVNGEHATATRTVMNDEFKLTEDELVLYALGDVAISRLNEKTAAAFESVLLRNTGIKRKIRFENHREEYEKVKEQKHLSESRALIEIERMEKSTKPVKAADKKSSKTNGTRGSMIRAVTGDVTAIGEITPESGRVIIEGELFKKDCRTIKSGKKLAYLFVTDKMTSICAKSFLTDDRWTEINERFQEGDFVRIQGEAEWDTFENMTILSVKAMEKAQKHERTDDCDKRRVELHAHTKMSALDGVTETEDMIKLAAFWGQKAIAITDHGVVQAFPDAARAVEKNKLDIKIIYGVEGYYFDDEAYIKDDGKIDYKTPKTNHIIILARTREGLKNLYKLISISHLAYFYKKPRIPKSVLSAHRDGLIIGSACEAGEVYRAVLDDKDAAAIEKAAEFYDYLEIQPLVNNQFLIDKGKVANIEELKKNNKTIVDLGEKLGKPVVATCDAHYLHPKDGLYRKILQVAQGYKTSDIEKGLYMRTTGEMLKEFSYLGEETARKVVIDAPNEIADMVERFAPVPPDKYPPKIENADGLLRDKCMRRAWEIYGNPLPIDIEDRLERELNSIINNGYAVMYVSAEMLVQKSLSDGYLVGARGSVGSSFAATMAGITEVNPLPAHYICPACKYFEWGDTKKYECGVDMDEKDCPVCGAKLNQDGFMIPFETFLGFDGDKEPDIDLNFAGEYQMTAHKYVEEIFGRKNVFRAGTIGTVAGKTAFGYVRKYFEECGFPANKWEMDRLTMCCTGVKRTTGQHPGGIIIVPEGHEIYEFCPVQHPPNDKDIVTTHFDYHAIDKNLLKLDILGHNVPSIIRQLQDMTGIDPLSLPLKDAKVNSIFNGVDGLDIKASDYKFTHGSYGIPEFGTRFVRQMLDDTKPEKFADLVKISGCSHGTDVWTNNALDYIKSGVATMDEIISTRDDIMRYLILKGLPNKSAFKIMERVRKGKGISEEEAELMRQNDVPPWYIESCGKIKYMFPRAHAVAYVMMSYRIAYYKVYYPPEFYAAYFTTVINDFDADTMLKGTRAILDKIAAIELKGRAATKKEEDEVTALEVAYEMYSRGFEFLPARIGTSYAMKFSVTGGKVLLALAALTGVGETAAKAIAEEYGKKPFDSIEELVERAKVNKTAIEALKEHGALAGLPESDQLSLF